MTIALQGSEAGPAQESPFTAGSGYRLPLRDDPQPLSAILLFRRDRIRNTRATGGIDSSEYQPRRGLAKGHSREAFVGVRWETLAPEPKRLSGPIQFVLKLLDSWRLAREDAVFLLGFDETDKDLVRSVLDGTEALHGRDVRDRIAHLFEIRKTLSALFRDLDVENEWLREPHVLLEGREPLKLLLGGSMENLLLVREYVDAAAGR